MVGLGLRSGLRVRVRVRVSSDHLSEVGVGGRELHSIWGRSAAAFKPGQSVDCCSQSWLGQQGGNGGAVADSRRGEPRPGAPAARRHTTTDLHARLSFLGRAVQCHQRWQRSLQVQYLFSVLFFFWPRRTSASRVAAPCLRSRCCASWRSWWVPPQPAYCGRRWP